jgi:hypothetical protein
MASMIDAVVMLHALGVGTGKITSDARYWDDARASHHLVESADKLVISAITWYEILRGLTENQRGVLAPWRGRIDVLAVDAAVAKRAAEIYAESRKSSKVCPKCFTFIKPVHCDRCGNRRSVSQHSNDIVMVATADVAPEIRVLYTWDGGVLELGKTARKVDVRKPPPAPPQQLDLDATTDIRSGVRGGASTVKRRKT